MTRKTATGVLTMCYLCSLVLVCVAPALAYDANDRAADEARLLDMHKQVLQYHIDNNLETWMKTESESYTSVSRGEILHPTIEERTARLKPYLDNTTFTEYRDLVAPIVKVSNDGSLGWVICQVKVAGVQATNSGGETQIESVWAWIELYEKQEGTWKRVGNVSNRRPQPVEPEHAE